MTKACPKCSNVLPLYSFGSRPNGAIRSWCRQCEAEGEKVRRTLTSDQLTRKTQLSRHQRSYWTVEAFDAAWEAQEGRCAICRREMTPRGKTATAVHADHHPVLNKPRSLLCSNCNSGLGFYRDDAETLRRAAAYIDLHNA